MIYDDECRLIGATGGGTNTTYVYDAIGRLIERRTSGASQSTNRFCYAGWQLIAEYDGAGAVQTEHVNGPGIDEPVRMQRGSSKYYFEQDGLGNVTEMVSGLGTVLERYTYDVYGTPTIHNIIFDNNTSLTGNRLMFTGRDRDPDTGLYNFRYRYFSPMLGRFVQPDPISIAGGDLNLYRYVANGPLTRVDPYGEKWPKWVLDVVAGISIGYAAIIADPKAAASVPKPRPPA